MSKQHDDAVAMIEALGGSAKVASRGNSSRGIVSHQTAQGIVSSGRGHFENGGKTIVLGDEYNEPKPEPKAVPGYTPKVTTEEIVAAQEKVAAEKSTAKKTNGRKAAAEKSPYSTAPVAGRIKRHGKSRRTGTETQIEDGLHKDATFKVKGSGRYRVSCLTHKQHKDVPDMTTAKPLQARTDEFCEKCVPLVAEREAAKSKTTDAAKAS